MKKKSLNDKFLDIADWVSEYMGHPSNIIFWAVAILIWTLLFALDKSLASANFLPTWFTSQAYNFPLNLITTVAELFIGFLVAAATNRAQRALTNLLDHIKRGLDNDVKMEKNIAQLIQENTSLTTKVHSLMTEVHEHILQDREEET